MPRYSYCLVRCVPEPRTGEFINLAAIAGDPEAGDWSLRQVSNEVRARRLANPATLAAVHEFLARVGEVIDNQMSLDGLTSLDELAAEPLDMDWLYTLHRDHRNVVQLSEPALVVAETAESALDAVFSRLLIDPLSSQGSGVTKHRVFSDLNRAYQHAIPAHFIRSRVELFVGDRLNTPIDFAIANGKAVQLSQAWSFQRSSIDDIATQVKAWGYTLGRLQDGIDGRILGRDNRVSTVSGSDVDLEVVIAAPETKAQKAVFDEANDIFHDLHVSVRNFAQVGEVSALAAELLHDKAPHQSLLT